MNDDFDNILKQLKYHAETLKKHKGRSGALKKAVTNIEKAQLQLSRYHKTKADDAAKQLRQAKKKVESAIANASTYIGIVADILGENTVSEEVLAFLRIEDRLTDQNMADVSLFEVGQYSSLKSRPGRDGMEMDHIPSKAALCQATCRHIETELKRNLNDKEVAAVLQVVEKLGGAIAVPKEMHNKLSRTIRGRNNEARIHQDSLDIIRAIKADVDAYAPELRRRGYSDNDIDMMYNNLVKHFKQFMEQLCRQK